MSRLIAGLALAAAFALPASAQEPLAARAAFGATKVSFDLPAGHFNATLSISGPDGRVLSASAMQGSPAIDISGRNAMGDGVYVWQMTAASAKTVAVPADEASGRDNIKTNMLGQMTVNVGTATSGTFYVQGGKIVDMSGKVEGAAR